MGEGRVYRRLHKLDTKMDDLSKDVADGFEKLAAALRQGKDSTPPASEGPVLHRSQSDVLPKASPRDSPARPTPSRLVTSMQNALARSGPDSSAKATLHRAMAASGRSGTPSSQNQDRM